MRHTNTANNHGHQIAGSFYSQGDLYNRQIDNNSYGSWSKIWNTTNDGSGSGLDADLLDVSKVLRLPLSQAQTVSQILITSLVTAQAVLAMMAVGMQG